MDQAESLRVIAGQNQNQRRRNLARVITVTSGKGGVGKTSTAVNLAIQLSRLGKRVAIFDADFGLANIEVMMGIRPVYNLADLMFKGKALSDILVDGAEGIRFISGGSGIAELTRLSKEQIVYLTEKLIELDTIVDIIIIDTSAGIGDSVIDFITASTEIILVATPEPTSITDAYALLKTLNRNSAFLKEQTEISLLANRISTEREALEIKDKLSVVSNKFLNIKLGYLGYVPQDINVSKSIIQQTPITVIFPSSPASKAYERIAEALVMDVKRVKEEKGVAHLFANLLRAKHKSRS
jgi:flagellar biosynthesis protein FlhG